jgi:crotonobetainyl-CoA:carnitine CoA-transferase CaiB-like acyl-CoA transferase
MRDDLWRALLTEAWDALALGGEPVKVPCDLEVRGAGRLQSRLPVEDTAIACIGTALLAAAALQAQRGAASPSLSAALPREDVAAAVRSEAYLRLDGEPVATGFAPLSRFWRARDGWVRTHANYPWHREALLRVLGVPDDVGAVAAAIGRLSASDVEERLMMAGGIAAAVRTEREWQAHPQGQAVAAQPLIAGTSTGDAAPRHRDYAEPPATGVRVLDLTRVIAGPVCTRFLAALGADVLRLDSPQRPELPLHAFDGLLGKRSALLDAGTREGLVRLHELLDGADVLVHGYRPHALDRFGLDPGSLAERHPGLVVVSLAAWGSSGPWGDRRGFDSIVQAACGIAMAESLDGSDPGKMPCQLLDHGTGYLCAAAVLDALGKQAGQGGTHFRELSLARTAHWLLGQPRAQAVTAATDPADGDIDHVLTVVSSAEGSFTVVKPPGVLDGFRLGWRRPLTSYGSDRPEW